MDIRLSNSQPLIFTVPFRAFTFTVDTTLTEVGSTASTQYELPLGEFGSTYDFVVEWGDGNIDTITAWNQAEATHTYSVGGVKTVKISGVLTHWGYFPQPTDAIKHITITEFGDVRFNRLRLWEFTNFTGGFIDTPKGLTNMSACFNLCTSFNEPVDDWDVSNVTILENCFRNMSYNHPLLNWDTSNVNSLSAMFLNNFVFNQDLPWNTSNVTNFGYCFSSASAFNGDITLWDTSAGTTMRQMFLNCGVFNQDLSAWNTALVTTMQTMFNGCLSFNSAIGGWNVGNVLNMNSMFNNADVFNQPLNSWNVSSCTDMGYMFYQADIFNQDISSWDVSNVTNMELMFRNTSFNQDLGAWDVGLVTDMTDMFLSTPMTQANYDLLLIGWTGWSGGLGGSASKTVQSSVPFGIGTVPYTLGGDAQGAHDWLTGTKLWTMTDGGGI